MDAERKIADYVRDMAFEDIPREQLKIAENMVLTVFGAAAVASRILGLDVTQTLNALALAFNRSGGSFQSNVDGSLAVRVIQGWVSQAGITCAQLGRLGVTGPINFLEGIYGYFHIYGKDKFDAKDAPKGLGKEFRLQDLIFKKYPSCALTLSGTEAILKLAEEEHLTKEDVERVEIAVHPFAYELVGHEFTIGDNPTVNAQFSVQYCVANALLRGCCKLCHFEKSYVMDQGIADLVKRIHVRADPRLEERGHTAVDLRVFCSRGIVKEKRIDVAPGFPGQPLSQKEHEDRFWDCFDYGSKLLPRKKAEKVVHLTARLNELEDVRVLIPLLLGSDEA